MSGLSLQREVKSSKSVWLYDWWLVKAEGQGLAVGGIASRGSLGGRAFCSTAIAKRHDTTTVDTADGITITISGLINRSRAVQNGIPLEVCNHFLHGFPYYWKEYADHCRSAEYANKGKLTGISRFAKDLNTPSECSARTTQPNCLDDIHATTMHQILISPGHSEYGVALEREILNLLRQCCSSTLQEGTSSDQTKAMDGHKYRADKRKKEIKTRSAVLTPGGGVVTRSMAKLQKVRSKQLKYSVTMCSTQSGGVATVCDLNQSYAAASVDSVMDIPKSPNNSSVRRSDRLKNRAKP